MGHCSKGPHMSYSPNKMGHESPAKNQNKGYAKQERKDLMQDMPIVKDAMGGRSWMSKHSKSALRMGHSPAEMGHSPLEIEDDEEAYNRGKARREYDIRKGILDPKTGKKTYKESKRKQKVFVTKMGKVLPVGSKAK